MVILSIPVFIAVVIGGMVYFKAKENDNPYSYTLPLIFNLLFSAVCGAFVSFVIAGIASGATEIVLDEQVYPIDRIEKWQHAYAIQSGDDLIAVPIDTDGFEVNLEACDDPTLTIVEHRDAEWMPDWTFTRYTICR